MPTPTKAAFLPCSRKITLFLGSICKTKHLLKKNYSPKLEKVVHEQLNLFEATIVGIVQTTDKNCFRRLKEELLTYKRLPQIFKFCPRTYDLSNVSENFTPFISTLKDHNKSLGKN